jgi:3-oxoacyl-[acyl-carrier protein] reductase
MKLLEGKTAVITGGSRGIGKGIALRFASEGADIAITNIIDNEEFAEAVKEIQALGVKAKGYVSDASVFAEAEEVIDEIVKDFRKIDILVNNAGITRDTLLMRMTEEQWDQVITVNLKSVFNLTKAAIRPMMRQKNGSIINMSSVVGVSGNAGQANYSASKAGILGFTKSVAKELGSRNVRCNAIAPGFILTEMTSKLPDDVKSDWISKIPLRRGGLPEDVANVALFLASDLSSYVTGQTISVCGGMAM